MTAARTPSQRGRRNRANGAAYEVKLANYLKAFWPDACRAVRNTIPDPGDIDGTSPSLWWSMKNCADERYPLWFAEMTQKATGRIGLLVVRRRGYADPGRWWCWLTLEDFLEIAETSIAGSFGADGAAQVRMELGAVIPFVRRYVAEGIAA